MCFYQHLNVFSLFLPSPAPSAAGTEEIPLWEAWTHGDGESLHSPECPDTTQRLHCPAVDSSLLKGDKEDEKAKIK